MAGQPPISLTRWVAPPFLVCRAVVNEDVSQSAVEMAAELQARE